MTFPRNLIDAYAALCNSALVRSGDTSNSALVEFARHLNAAQPVRSTTVTAPVDTASQLMQAAYDDVAHQTVHALYHANRRGYIGCIRNTANEATVLWTDARSVVMWFGLTHRVYIKHKDGRFWVRAITESSGGATTPVEPKYVRKPMGKPIAKKAEDIDVDFPVIKDDEIVLQQ